MDLMNQIILYLPIHKVILDILRTFEKDISVKKFEHKTILNSNKSSKAFIYRELVVPHPVRKVCKRKPELLFQRFPVSPRIGP